MMKIGDQFKAIHGSMWTVTVVREDCFLAKSSDNIEYPFTNDGRFGLEERSEPHPYDYEMPWADHVAAELAKAEEAKIQKDEADRAFKAAAEQAEAEQAERLRRANTKIRKP
jgi:hypothetical protein